MLSTAALITRYYIRMARQAGERCPRKGWPLSLLLVVALSWCSTSAFRPGGDSVVRLTPEGQVVQANGETLTEYELRESDPILGHFVSLGVTAHGSLKKAGYAYGDLVSIAHSDRDKEFGEDPDRKGWFPMFLQLTVSEDGPEPEGGEVEVKYEVTLEYDSRKYQSPGLAVMDARRLRSDGSLEVELPMPPPKEASFFEKNRKGITMMFGVIIASGLVKIARRVLEGMMKRLKKPGGADGSREEGDTTDKPAADAAGQEPSKETTSKKAASRKKKD